MNLNTSKSSVRQKVVDVHYMMLDADQTFSMRVEARHQNIFPLPKLLGSRCKVIPLPPSHTYLARGMGGISSPLLSYSGIDASELNQSESRSVCGPCSASHPTPVGRVSFEQASKISKSFNTRKRGY